MLSSFSSFRGLPPVVWTVFAGTVVNRLGYLVTPFLVFFLATRDVTGTQVSYVLGALGVGNLLGPAVGGLLADRIGRRPTMLAGLVAASVGQGALFLAPSVATMAAAALLISAAGSMVGPAASALLADAVDAAHRQRAYALFQWGVNIGTAVAGVLGGFLAAHGYWLLFAVDAGSMLVFAAVVAFRLREHRPAAPGGATAAAGERRTDGIGYGVVLRDRLGLALLPLFGVQLFVYSLTEVALPLAIHDSGLSPSVYGAMAALNAVMVVLLQPVVTARLTRLPQLPVQCAGGVLIAVGVAMTGLADSVAGYAFSVVVWSVGEVAVAGIAASVIANLAPAHARGRYQGAFGWMWGTARFAALTLGVALYSGLGPGVLWWTALAAGIACSVATLAFHGRVARRMDHVLAA
ncbi:Predicted arabinose efflux permease, MFS family [Actinopolymorpha cephalotaxi]|uniref:MFS family permease n=1 Tax=Actinopolymorpha cephalotaxi TaxID=504797 RepID=A0A1I2MX63_9ACTN|nr:MFS transporter [Actinopolymorpha cephalotaxi]NYH85824.1 MFS family permease [Actinopolymorpha cephalotaxi]SFF95239.1 Predicted arabinose efflux permease, MFS family [Actinopolymorpha cephalotaxi]